MILSTERLILRKITHEDFNELAKIFCDIDVMYAWEHTFTDTQIIEWIDKNLERYKNHGYSYFAAIQKHTNEFIGVMGPLVETIGGSSYTGIGYILNKSHWGKGYGVEGAKACMECAFDVLGTNKVIAQIRPENTPSIAVAKKIGMVQTGEFIKHYNGMDMLHYIFQISKKA